MVLPGIQGLFGFQLIAVFNRGFSQSLPPLGRLLHLGAIVLVACAIALIMAPAAYHRQAERDRISTYFAEYASRMITVAMAQLLVALCVEVALVAYAINRILWVAARHWLPRWRVPLRGFGTPTRGSNADRHPSDCRWAAKLPSRPSRCPTRTWAKTSSSGASSRNIRIRPLRSYRPSWRQLSLRLELSRPSVPYAQGGLELRRSASPHHGVEQS